MNTSSQISYVKELEAIKYFSNVKDGRINDSILVLVTENRNIDNLLYEYCQYVRIMTNFVMVNMEDVTEELINDFGINLIIKARKGIDDKKIHKSFRRPLIYDLKSVNPNAVREPHLEMILSNAANKKTEQSFHPLSHLAYLKVQNPIDLVYLGAEDLMEYLHLVLNDARTSVCLLKKSHSQFKGKSLNEIRFWQEMIKNDIWFLQNERKLTSRLWILIYKVSTLNDEMSNTAIGTFFRKSMGIKSRALYNKHFRISNIKGYDLNKPQIVHNPKLILNNPYTQY